MDIPFGYEPIPNTGQVPFWESSAPFPALVGPARIGKTESGAARLILDAIQYPAQYMVLGPTYTNHILLATRPKYERLIPKEIIELTADGKIFHETHRRIRFKEEYGGAEILFRSTDEPDKLMGGTLGGIHADEAGLMPEEAFEVMRYRLAGGGGAKRLICTFTPKGSKKHWTNRIYGRQLEIARAARDRGELGVGVLPEGDDFHDYPAYFLRLEDNPHLPKWLVTDLKRRAEDSPKARQEFYGDWTEGGGLVYDSFDYRTHVSPMPSNINLIHHAGGVDFGMSAATVILVVTRDQSGGCWWTGEFYQPHCRDDALVQALRGTMDRFPGIRFAGDPKEPKKMKRLRQEFGIPIWPADNSVNGRVTAIWDLLAKDATGRPGIRVTPDCVNSISEFESWSFKATSGPGGSVMYDDVEPHYHCMDAGGYAILQLRRQRDPIPVLYGNQKVGAYA